MANCCFAAFVIEGDKKEMDELHSIMKSLNEMDEPRIKNGYGTTWLGCLLDAIGVDWRKAYCRGRYTDLEYNGNISFNVESDWEPCTDVFDEILKKYPSLSYYYDADIEGEGYETNDKNGKYFTDRIVLDGCYPYNDDYFTESFQNIEDAMKYMNETYGTNIKDSADFETLDREWRIRNEESYLNVYEYRITNCGRPTLA